MYASINPMQSVKVKVAQAHLGISEGSFECIIRKNRSTVDLVLRLFIGHSGGRKPCPTNLH